jgi:hypothetical protein
VSSRCGVESGGLIQSMRQAEPSMAVRCVLWWREGCLGSGEHA